MQVCMYVCMRGYVYVYCEHYELNYGITILTLEKKESHCITLLIQAYHFYCISYLHIYSPYFSDT